MFEKNAAPVMVCVADRPDCNHVLKAAAKIAAEKSVPLLAVAVLPNGHMTPYATERLQVLYNIAERHGAELLVLFSEHPALTVAVTARQREAVQLVAGAPQSGHFIEMLKALLPEIPLTVIPSSDQKVITV